jgi:hypothetical protein
MVTPIEERMSMLEIDLLLCRSELEVCQDELESCQSELKELKAKISDDPEFDSVRCKDIYVTRRASINGVVCGSVSVEDSEGKRTVLIGSLEGWGGVISLMNKENYLAVLLGSDGNGAGSLDISSNDGEVLVNLSSSKSGDGVIDINNADGGKGVKLMGADRSDTGGVIRVYSGEGDALAVALCADDYGDGVLRLEDRNGPDATPEA